MFDSPRFRSTNIWVGKSLVPSYFFIIPLFIIVFGIFMYLKGIVWDGVLIYMNGIGLIIIGLVIFILLVLAKTGKWKINKKYN